MRFDRWRKLKAAALTTSRIILDLCGGTGSWSAPYREAGYDVRLVTMPEADVREYEPPENVHGILAAPPCTVLAVSGAQYWHTRPQSEVDEAFEIVKACMDIIRACEPAWWCLENPVGRLKDWVGPPAMIFDPWEYGDPYTKKACLWGHFQEPLRDPVEPVRSCKQGSWLQKLSGQSEKTKRLRSVTPPGFARAFFVANP
jgi:hypothetical protein